MMQKDWLKLATIFLENPSESRQKGEEAYQIAKKYPLHKMKEQYLDIYQALDGTVSETMQAL